MMHNQRNRLIYRLWSPIYDWIFKPLFDRVRRQAIQYLDLQPGETLLIAGVGTGLDLPYLPAGVRATGIDLSAAMLEKARQKPVQADVTLQIMDAQQLDFAAHQFDAVLLSLVLSVVPDGRMAFAEAWRVLRPGGRAVIFDKFLPEDQPLTPVRRVSGYVIRLLGTDPNRRLSAMIDGIDDLKLYRNEASLLAGQYRIIMLEKGT